MTDWHHFWQNYRLVDITGDERLLFQVGKTVHGEVIDKLHFRILIEEIIDVLEINENDNILDLCCGNGVLTFELSRYAKYVLGIDFSKPFIENALKYKKNKNIDYLLSDVKELRKSLNNLKEKRFNKILLYDALAYFDEKELDALL
jgi:ubiquinone/menaquinone biosynthesis C-methylase UbiE